jgi:hypothetical protein
MSKKPVESCPIIMKSIFGNHNLYQQHDFPDLAHYDYKFKIDFKCFLFRILFNFVDFEVFSQGLFNLKFTQIKKMCDTVDLSFCIKPVRTYCERDFIELSCTPLTI